MNTMLKMCHQYDMMFVTCINYLWSLILVFKLDCNQPLVVGQILPSVLKERCPPFRPH